MIPREQGGWGILIFSIILGTGVANRVGLPLFLFIIATIALYMARYPLTLMVKGASNSRVIKWEAIFIVVAIVAFLPLLFVYNLWWLILFGVAFALYLGVYLYLVVTRKQRTVLGEMASISGLSMAAPAAYYVALGSLSGVSLYLWLLSFLYHASSVYYVKLKIKHRTLHNMALSLARKLHMGRALAAYLVILFITLLALGLIGQIPVLVMLAFLPLAGKAVSGIFSSAKVISIRVLGWTEVVHGLLFTGLAVIAYRISS